MKISCKQNLLHFAKKAKSRLNYVERLFDRKEFWLKTI